MGGSVKRMGGTMAPTLPKDPLHVRLTGRGGQGIILAGAILAEGAMRDGNQVIEAHEYGPEARLGATKADITISHGFIAFPEVLTADVMLCLSRDGFLRYGQSLAHDGVGILDTAARDEFGDDPRLHFYQLRETARSLGDEIVINIVGLAVLAKLSGAISDIALAHAVTARVKPEFRALNESALAAGAALVSTLSV